MKTSGIPNEYLTRVNLAVNYILKHLSDDLSLPVLATVADYSPFHFQKIFKQVTGESPKQYVIRVRLETAAHALLMHHHKTITAVAFEHGFSSSAVFARAFRSYFGVSAEEFRANSRRERIVEDSHAGHDRSETEQLLNSLNIRVIKKKAARGIFVNAQLRDEQSVQKAFEKIVRLADAYDLATPGSLFAGAIYLHSEIYRAMLIADERLVIPTQLNVLEIPGGKYAVLDLSDSFLKEMPKLRIFVNLWLPANGYRLADIVGYEILAENPIGNSYGTIKKEIHIPIEPVG